MSFLSGETLFQSFTWPHFSPIILFGILALVSISYANTYLDDKGKTYLGCILAIIPLLFVLLRAVILMYQGTFDYKADLPMHLCRVAAVIAPVVMFTRNRFWLVILYFWIIVGTLNANITPDLDNGFPHFEYICYFGLHSGLLVLPFYTVFVYDLRISWSDLWRAFLVTNLFFLIVHCINWLLGSNYMYTMQKPASASLLDHMGPWPWYILSGQFVVLVMMFAVFFPLVLLRSEAGNDPL